MVLKCIARVLVTSAQKGHRLLKLKPISNSMKSNEEICVFFDLLPLSVPSCRSAKIYLNMPGDLGHVLISTSSTQLMAQFTTWMNAEFVKNLNLMRFFSG